MTKKEASDKFYPKEEKIGLERYLFILKKRKWYIIFLTALSVVICTFWTLKQPKIYQAETSVLIEANPPKVLGNKVDQVIELGGGNYWADREYLETQYKILKSHAVAKGVVQELKLHLNPRFLDLPKTKVDSFSPISVDKAAQILRGKITIEPIKDSRLVLVKVEHRDPELAMTLANTIAEVYMKQNIEHKLSSTIDALNWLSKQLSSIQKKLERSELALHRFKQENKLVSVSLADKQNILVNQIQRFSQILTETKTKKIELWSQREQIRRLLSKKEDPLSIPLPSFMNNGLIQKLKEKYALLAQKYNELRVRYLSKHPKVIEIQAKLNSIKKALKNEIENLFHSIDSEYQAVLQAEQELKRTLEKIKTEALKLNLKEIQYKRLEREKENNEKIYAMVLTRTKETDLTRLLKVNNIRILDRARKPITPVRPKTKLNIILSLIFGLILGVGVVFLREYLDDTIKSQEDIEEIFNLPLLGYIPLMNKHNSLQKKKKGNGSKEKSTLASEKELFLYYYPKSQVAECFRAIRTNLLFMSPDAPFKKILITSACPEEGKTTIAVNLAIAMAQSGLRVLLLDTDMRRSRLHKIFPTKGSPGLTRLILGKTTIPEALLSSDIPNLFVIPSGLIPPNPAELLQTERFKEVLKELSFQFDRIILDSPPALIVTDSVILGTLIDGCIFVVKSAKTTKGALKQMKRSFLDVGVNIIGCLLNETREGKKGYKYPSYYFKKYGYYYEESETPEEKNRENS